MFKKLFFCVALTVSFSSAGYAKNLVFLAQDFFPFNSSENSKVSGAMVDIMTALCVKMNHTCKFELFPMVRAVKMVEVGAADGVMSMYPTPEREKIMHFSTGIVHSSLVYMASSKQKTAPMKSIDELAGYTVIATRGSAPLVTVQEHAKTVKNIKIVEEVGNPTAVRDITRNGYGPKALLIGTEETFRSIAKQQNVELDTIYTVNVKNFITGFSKSKFSEAEVKEWDKAIDALKKDGSMAKILVPYNLKPAGN